MAGGGGGGQKQETERTIPDELKPAATALSGIATRVGNTPYQAYGGQGVAGMNDMQQQALGKYQSLAGNDGIQKQSEATLSSLMQGGNNPYLDQAVQKAQDSVRSNMAAAAAGSGSFGNSGIEEAMGRQMGDTAAQMYGGAYAQDRANQLQALGLQSGVQQSAFTNAQNLMNAGKVAQDNAQNKADFDYQQYLNQQDYPLKQLSALSGTLNSASGSKTNISKGGK